MIKADGKPSGPRQALQFNDAGDFGGAPALTYDSATGTFTLTGPQLISLISDVVALTLKASAGQTQNVLEVCDSDDNPLAYLHALARLQAQRLSAGVNGEPEEDTIIRVAHNFEGEPGTTFGIDMDMRLNYAADNGRAASAAGLALTSEGDFGPNTMTGFFVEVSANANNTLDSMWGLYFAGYHTGSGDVNKLIGGYFSAFAGGSGVINNLYGAFIDSPDGQTEAVNTAYGLYIKDQQVGTVRYSIFTGTGLNSFGDDLEFRDADTGPILIDRTTATRYRLYVDNGALAIEVA